MRLSLRSACYSMAVCTVLAVSFSSVAAQVQATASRKDPIASKSSQPVDIAGDWQVSWENRLGTQKCDLHLQQDGTKLTGTLRDVHGVSPLTVTVDDRHVSFDVQFQGAHPFTIRFSGSTENGEITGTSQAIGVGGAGAYLGHGGEVVQPEHPWSAKRTPPQSGDASRGSNAPTKN